jgi:CubicO group peptidase (beta-lactamase class C family)
MSPSAALKVEGVRNVALDEPALRAHVITPPALAHVVSSRGLEEGMQAAKFTFPPTKKKIHTFDGAGFCDALHAALKDSVAGYVMRMRQNGATIYTLEWNWAKEPVDGGEGWNPDVRMHIASCSKLVTAIAMTKLLHDKGISYDAPIISHLPNYWVKGPGVDKITFAQLMTHHSGLAYQLPTSASDYAFMKAQVAAGVPNIGKYSYQNMNFGLCRILISTINGNIAPSTTFPLSFLPDANDMAWDYVTINAYAAYVNSHVFSPSGVSGPTLTHPSPDALAYTFPVSGSGWNSGDLSTMAGGAGWHMSVDDLLSVMHTFRKAGSILPATEAQNILDRSFGIDLTLPTPLGDLYNKNGLWADGAGHTEQSLAYFFPQNIECVVLANSPIGNPAKFFRDVVTQIYVSHVT